jgi:hypothetical protein
MHSCPRERGNENNRFPLWKRGIEGDFMQQYVSNPPAPFFKGGVGNYLFQSQRAVEIRAVFERVLQIRAM